ncbi:hypothetical protein PACTADRAFT_47761 [Pachysolen tannophilus NRRL Y-2460]|uniref:Octanoyltransferase n=1 Tax=Pachysolen tannophilus NRRL Y-2460 TaxID=669874 RepID=A0A1E4U208_PACTA|nr:hypothetical protein PACTADRAFT_47761 [Pachysolen tannophilus NRRL Y-2460]
MWRRLLSSSASCGFSPLVAGSKIKHYHFQGVRPYLEGDLIQEWLVSSFLKTKEYQLYSRNPAKNEFKLLSLPEPVEELYKSQAILSFEFESTYTAGKREKINHNQPLKFQKLQAEKNIKLIQTSRGGQITYHGPGQCVIYPILDLSLFKKLTSKCYVSTIEKTMKAVLQNRFGISTITNENTGIWIDDNLKISSIGCNVRRWITSHGISVNVNPDLKFMNDEDLVICGLPGKRQTSIKEQLQCKDTDLDLFEVATIFSDKLANKLGVSDVEHYKVEKRFNNTNVNELKNLFFS